MEILLDVFCKLLLIVGILCLAYLIGAMIIAPIKIHKQNKLKKEFIEKLAKTCLEAINEELNEPKEGVNSSVCTKKPDAKTYTNTTKRTRKTKEN